VDCVWCMHPEGGEFAKRNEPLLNETLLQENVLLDTWCKGKSTAVAPYIRILGR